MGIQNATAKREQHAQSDEIVQQYNIMSTQVVSGAVTSGGPEIPESSSKLRHGHLSLDTTAFTPCTITLELKLSCAMMNADVHIVKAHLVTGAAVKSTR